MTIIVWDGKTLAADKRSTNNNRVNTVTKIARVRDCLCAFSGDAVFGIEMMEWFRHGAKPENFPEFQRNDNDWTPFIAIINPGVVTRYERSPYPLILEDPIYAMGSGRDYALMALHLGKTAREAVLLTQELTVCCWNGVDTLEFDE